jgi:hypothetical protein
MLGNREERAPVLGNPAINVARVLCFYNGHCLIDLKKNQGNNVFRFALALFLQG